MIEPTVGTPECRTSFWPGVDQWLRHSTGAVLAVTLGAALVGQHVLDEGENLGVGLGLLGAAMVLFALLYRHRALSGLGALVKLDREPRRVRWGLVALAIPVGALAYFRLEDNLFTRLGTPLWAAGLGLLILAAGSRLRLGRWLSRVVAGQRDGLVLRRHHLALMAIMVLGAFYRLHRIVEIPREMGCDLPHIYNNIRLILRSEYLIFFPSYPGREGLFFYMAAPVAKVIGLDHTSIKVASALIGVATLPAIYLLGRELYGREAGIYAAFFMSVSHWHVILTRIGFRLCTMPLVLALMLTCLARAMRSGSRAMYALAGLLLGLGLYTYNAYMIVPLTVVAILAFAALARQWSVRRDWGGALLLVLTAVMAFVPLGRYVLTEPKEYFFRAATRITSVESPLPSDLVMTFLRNNVRAFMMFNVEGDGVFVANVPFLRQLGFFAATLFALGFAYALVRWRRGLNTLALVSLVTLLLPTTLSLAFPHEVPNGGRAVGAIVPALLFSGVALSLVRCEVAALLARGSHHEWSLSWKLDEGPERVLTIAWGRGLRTFAGAVLVVVLVYEAVTLYPLYFKEYVEALPERNFSISLAMAEAIDDFSDDGESYIRIWPYWHDGNAVRAQLRREDQSWHNEVAELAPGIPPLSGPPAKFMVILHPDDTGGLALLERTYPTGIALRRLRPDGTLAFYLFYGER